MKNLFLAGIAAVALCASPAFAQGKGNGGDGGGGGGGAAAKDRGGNGGGKGEVQKAAGGGNGGNAAKANNVGQAQAGKADRSADRAVARGNGGGDARRDVAQVDKGNNRNSNGAEAPARVQDARGADVRRDDRDDLRPTFAAGTRGLIDGCPPGLAAKNNGCTPPGLARQAQDGWRESLYQPSWWGYQGLGGGNYAYDNGYLYRLNPTGGIAGYLPLLGGALGIGNGWPSTYQSAPLPDYYQRYYGLGPADTYRYADNVVYRVDPSSSAITAIAALLTGDTFNVGQQMPIGYDAYNVPYPYRNQYQDGPDAAYRYSDGYVYQVDPKTQLITKAIELLAGKIL